MEEEKLKVWIGGRVTTTKAASEKVTNMVGTFLNKESDRFRVPAIQIASEKVVNTVTTFLKEGNDSFQLPATKTEPEKVTNTVGTFCPTACSIINL